MGSPEEQARMWAIAAQQALKMREALESAQLQKETERALSFWRAVFPKLHLSWDDCMFLRSLGISPW